MVRIGIIGLGGIARSVHIPGIAEATGGRITAICDPKASMLKEIGDAYHIPEDRRFQNYLDLINCADVDAVEICTPNFLHIPMAVAAVRAGKAINVEKPLSVNYAEAQKLEDALRENSVPNMMCFSCRFRPAVRYAKEILSRGLLGDILSVNAEYLKSSGFWAGRRLEWRFVKEYAGTGVLGDLGVHLVDMARFLVGDMTQVCAEIGIAVKQRKKLNSDEIGTVETDDYCSFMADFECGAHGMFKVTRCAIGHENTVRFDIFGTKGFLSFDLNTPDKLSLCIGEVDAESCGIHTVKVPDKYQSSQEQMFIDLVSGKDCPYLPTVADGLRSQKVLDALLESSEKRCWVSV